MNIIQRIAAFARVPLSGSFVTDKGGSDSQAHREMGRKAKHGGTAPTPQSDSGGAVERGGSRAPVARTRPQGDGQAKRATLPQWLRERHTAETKARHRRALDEAERTGKPVGLLLDQQTKQVLADAKRGTISAATMAKYRRDVELMRERGQTPADAANSAKHWSRLRAAWLAVEVTAIQQARASAEKYRKAGDLDTAQKRTREAWERSLILDAMFLQPSAPRWSDRRAAMKAAGQKPARKSKRFGPQAPTPEALLVNMGKVRGALSRHDKRAAMLALFGMRPEEMRKGVSLTVSGGLLKAKIQGAKVDGQRGHCVRFCAVPAKKLGPMDGAVAAWLAQCVTDAGGTLKIDTSDADIQSLNNALNRMEKGLSCYSFRHAIGSNLKAAAQAGEVTQEDAAAFMGHRSEKSLSYYGRATQGRKGRRYKAVVAKDIEPPIKANVTRAAKAKAKAAKAEVVRFPPKPQRPEAAPKAARQHAPRTTLAKSHPLAGGPRPPRM